MLQCRNNSSRSEHAAGIPVDLTSRTSETHAAPIPQAGLALAIFSLGNLLPSMLPEPWWTPVHIVCAGFGLVFLVPVLGRHLHAIRNSNVRRSLVFDYCNPLIAPLTTTVPMAIITLGTYLIRFGHAGLLGARILWWIGAATIALLMGYLLWRFVMHGFQLENVCPAWLVGFVGILVAAVTSGMVRLPWAGRVIFHVGFVIDIVMLMLISTRIAWFGLPDAIRPTMAIYTAPVSLLVASYTSTYPRHNPLFMLMLITCAQLLFAFAVILLPWMLAAPVSPAWAAFTFPMVITATALRNALDVLAQEGWLIPAWFQWLQIGETALACSLVVAVAIIFIRHPWKR
ncbi:TDT family transporter [Bifidobacterium sp. SO4]|uniref:TDT family transporter n=1 Tax=Bifidobacterium sp. SO4 TaxID=2809030 RepID=UPI001BDC5962|nr:TDT family transporter [Bifidobacterium sp. SO4]MBT1170075.1 TDT family transporter [Bifidobacterium sp. SO4]